MKWSDNQVRQTKIGTTTVNWLQPRKSLANRIIPRNWATVKESLIVGKPHVLTVDEWERRQSWQSLIPYVKALATIPLLMAFVYGIYMLLWLLSPGG